MDQKQVGVDVTNKNKASNLSFLRWAGGKNWLIKSLDKFIPKEFNNYYEPFIGGCSVFLSIKPQNKIFLSDLNADLINCYTQVRDSTDVLIERLEHYQNDEAFYYKTRSTVFTDPVDRAAQFIFLNKTCFNGIYRVNKLGQFNVPYGFRKNIDLADSKRIYFVRDALRSAEINVSDFEPALQNIGKNDLVFLDPPYTIAHNKNGFIEYNQHIFSWKDQIRLAEIIKEIQNRQAFFILTNAVHDSIFDLYTGIGKKYEVERFSTIGGPISSRKKTSEIIICNTI